jgi:GH25 family lysozyme M1 (1,4-beta-N-acetylmuramidase)
MNTKNLAVTALKLGLLPLATLLTACSGGGDGDGTTSADDQSLTVVCEAPANGPVQGVDVSVYQGNFDFAGAHVSFGYTRISDGLGTQDPTFGSNWANMKATGVLRGAYQFFEPGEDEVAQADLVIAKVGRLGVGDLPVMLDIEVTGGQAPATIRAKAAHWLQLVEAGTGKRPFIYSYGSFLESNLGAGFGAYPLWIAAYGPACPSVPTGWSHWLFWQYSDGGGHLDHDVFAGSAADLAALAGAAADVGTPQYPYRGVARDASGKGYWIAGDDGGVFTYGDAAFHGSAGMRRWNAPMVGIASTHTGKGYWLVGADGGIFTYGDAPFHGSAGNIHLNQPIVGMAAMPDSSGYWLVASDGGVFTYGNAGFHGSMGGTKLNAPVVGIAATPSGKGYWLVAADGGIFGFGDAAFHGSMGGEKLNAPVVGIAATPSGNGYWLVASDGGIFTFGDAAFHGSMGGKKLNTPIVGMTATPDGGGYWLVGGDGGIFTFGNAPFAGSRG